MKPETLVMKIIDAMETNSPTLITYNGKKVHITQKIIDKYKHCKVRDDIDLERIDENLTKKGGFLPFLPLIFAGLTAAGAVKAANASKAAAVKEAEERRHNLAMEREARGGSGIGDILGTVKEFGQRFGEETKKTVKEGLSKLIDKIDTGEMEVLGKLISLLTTPNLLDFDSLYIYTTTPEQSYYQFLKALEYLPKKDVQDLFQYYEENEEVEIKDIIDNYIEGKNPTDIKVFLMKNV
ncbi:hypothetical protein LOTGIDRAFT_174009 [Lottia gigantea]|uniref:Uncharacterized protein n=1 Tax=Lottia gigantea TaxID=225164 RepID=V4AVG2_LOTGI|nr:hypothetical protein LOTGIDRAFT_174009 [Lottia gigantea]ESO99010.1 hypothetical protein LOTGIDRAFT_174009 [Lottia gigantea]